MKRFPLVAGTVALTLYLSGCASVLHLPPIPEASSSPASPQELADSANPALWGFFTQMPGASYLTTRNGGQRLTWRWLKPGQVMEENWAMINADTPTQTYTMWRGEQPGVLYLKTPGSMANAWKGYVQNDGSVLFEGLNMMAVSFQVLRTQDGAIEVRAADIQNGTLQSLSPLQPADRYALERAAPAIPDSMTLRAASGKPPATASSPSAPKAIASSDPTAASSAQAARDERARQAGAATAQAQQQLDAARQQLSEAQTASDATQSKAKTLAAQLSPPNAKGKGGPVSKNGDFWSYCYFSGWNHDRTVIKRFITNLINQRIYEYPYPSNSQKAQEELDAYKGPNTPYEVEKRFARAIETSGLLPDSILARSYNCATYISLDMARSHYRDYTNDNDGDPPPVQVIWNRLEDEQLAGYTQTATRQELEQARKEAEHARKELLTAQEGLRQQERRLKLLQEDEQRARDCAAGKTSSCGARGTKN